MLQRSDKSLVVKYCGVVDSRATSNPAFSMKKGGKLRVSLPY